MLSGAPERALSTLGSALQEGSTVVLDSIDAMLLGIKGNEPLRPLLQLIYSNVKSKGGSLVIISEGTSPYSEQLKFLADALISLDIEEVLGHPARRARIIKDRDYRIQHPALFYTLGNGVKILEPNEFNAYSEIKKLGNVVSPIPLDILNAIKMGTGYLLTEMDEEVPYVAARLRMEFRIIEYLLKGYSVNYFVPPEENDERILRVISLAGDKSKNFKIIHADASAAGYDPERFEEQILRSSIRENAISVLNLQFEEDFAVVNPANFEIYLKKMIANNARDNVMSQVYGYTDLNATRIVKKYVKLVGKMTVRDGFLFLRNIKPPGSLWNISINTEWGEIKFTEMV